MIVLKTLAREFDLTPAKTRKLLRGKFEPTNRRWKWQPDDPQLSAIRSYLSTVTQAASRRDAPSAPPT